MFENKKPDQIVPGAAQGLPGEISVPSGLPAEISSSYPAPAINPNAKNAKFVTPTPSVSLPPEHASLPPVNSLGDGSVKITLPEWIEDSDSARQQSKGSEESGPADFARAAKRQFDRLYKAA